MAQQNHLFFTILSLLLFTGFVLSEWEVLNSDLENRDDDSLFMPASSPSSTKSKSNKNKVSLAQKTYQTSTAADPIALFQNFALSSNEHQENSDVIKMTSGHKGKKHNFKSTANRGKKSGAENTNSNKNENKATKKTTQKPTTTTKKPDTTQGYRSRDLLEESDYNPEDSLKNVEEYNADSDSIDEREFHTLMVEEERKLRKMQNQKMKGLREMEEEDINCDELINQKDLYDCLYLQNERQRLADETNISEAGDRAREQLLDFMDLNNRHRRAVGDEGSGAGPTYPPEENIHNGLYNLQRKIQFKVNSTDSTDELTELLQEKLSKVFDHLNGFVKIKVKNVVNANGVVSGEWTLSVRGNGIGAYGGSEQDIANALQFQLLNMSKPLFDTIDLGGANPENPLDTRDIANSLANNLQDICGSDNPCSSDFDSCTVIGYDEGVCLHKCTILEQTNECQHGGYCEIETAEDGSNEAVCQCTSNWEGTYCESRRNLNPGEITGVTVGAALAVAGLIGTCCWLAICRRRRKPVNMTYYGDDSDSSERFSNPSSKISTFVIDRPRIRAAPIRSFSPHSHDDFSRPSSLSSIPPLMRPRQPPNLFSDA